MGRIHCLLVGGLLAVALCAAGRPASASGLDAGSTGSSSTVPEIILYTMEEGEVLFQRFGHAALCVEYPDAPRRDRCYNYGTTDFSDPITLGWDFLRGKARFWVSVTTPARMLDTYGGLDRTIWRQKIPLTDQQARTAAAALAHDALPENRYYIYHHYYDNCTTRLRDIIDDVTGGALHREADEPVGPSFREFGRRGFADQKWLLIIDDFFMGRRGDIQPNVWQAMFLPDYLRVEVHERLGAEPEMLTQRQGGPVAPYGGSGRGWILLFAVLLAMPIAVTRVLGRRERLGVALATGPLFVLALVTWGIALITTLPEGRYNEALLIFWPTDIVLPFLSAARRQRYAQVRVACLALVSLLVTVGVLLQPLWVPMLVAFLPMVILAVRARAPAVESQAARAQEASPAESSPA